MRNLVFDDLKDYDYLLKLYISRNDTKVKLSSISTNATFPLLASAQSNPTSGTAYEAIYDAGIKINPSKHSVAEGSGTASGNYSHAEGYNTIANQEAMTAVGKYNSDGSTGDLFAVGNGTSTSDRSTIFSANINGTVTKGTVKIENTTSTEGGTMRYDSTEKCIKFSFS